ncbi:rhomboid family intramembrane serine protease [Marinigracilibium pacificum]|uniref:Rhomboid family intramembrane serine protease n=1 Tax=Marinigracilibium pacificum TaxID=2729599 RepID=A0A848J3J2_9BACT|nr:rhomboid family intramembrane serine protease [Marinigracilibium pacificum]NMM50306.1 rhomboid family intramembrane serine protease [Marinigracilibium pacificum]
MFNSFIDDFKNAWNRPNNAVMQLIFINVIIFLVMAVLWVLTSITGFGDFGQKILIQLFYIPASFGEFIYRPWTIITYAFAHNLEDIFHILFNMLFLYWFGKLILEYLGSDRVISIYINGAIAGAVLYLLAYNFIPFYIERTPGWGMIGASAAVDAIVVAAATLLPNYTFHLLLLGPVRIKYIAAFVVVMSFIQSTGGNAGGNIAHLGGAFMGWLYIVQLQKGTDLGRWVFAVRSFFIGLFKPKPKIKVTYKKSDTTSSSSSKSTSTSGSKADKASQDEIDRILDKISEKGYSSLSKEEKQKLFDASKK